MPNDLVRWRGSDGTPSNGAKNGAASNGAGRDGVNSDGSLNALGHPTQAGDEWDLPPEQMGYGLDAHPPMHTAHTERAAQAAETDARRARSLGDITFATIREADAGDLRQARWDWGDLRTWLWIFGMCALFLFTVALCYFLPYGRHASPPPIRPY